MSSGYFRFVQSISQHIFLDSTTTFLCFVLGTQLLGVLLELATEERTQGSKSCDFCVKESVSMCQQAGTVVIAVFICLNLFFVLISAGLPPP